jgi:hypothetical protein
MEAPVRALSGKGRASSDPLIPPGLEVIDRVENPTIRPNFSF